MTDAPDLLSAKQAAEYLTVSRRTVYREKDAGRLGFVKVRGSTRFRRSELERYIAERERRGRAAA